MEMSLDAEGGSRCALQLLNHVLRLVLWQIRPQKLPELLNSQFEIAGIIVCFKQTDGVCCESEVKYYGSNKGRMERMHEDLLQL